VRNRQVFPAGRDTVFSRAGNYRRAWRSGTRRLRWTGFVGCLSCSEDGDYALSGGWATKLLKVKTPTELSVSVQQIQVNSASEIVGYFGFEVIVPASSRASPLPQFFASYSVCGRHGSVWERACPRRRSDSRLMSEAVRCRSAIRCIIPYRFCPRPFLDALQSPARLCSSQRSTE
jgi:hypothetical protein